jgi:transposase
VAFREVQRMEVIEVVRRWQAGESQRAIARSTGLSRNTVEKYLRAARAAGVNAGGEPPGDDVVLRLVRLNETAPLPAAPQAASLEQQRERIARWLKDDHLLLTRIHELLARDGVAVSYTTLRRYVRRAGLWKQPQTTVRMADWPPGEAAEMDFGKLGMLVDSARQRKRSVSALIVTLPASRYPFVWPMHRQTLAETIAGLEAAWQFFGGIPKRLLLDNFAAAVAGPDPLNPRLTRGFLEYSQARGFFCDPARVRRPRDKPHVESNVRYVRERFFKGGSFRDLEDCRQQAEHWCREIAGLRVHGTTRQLPREVFEAEEQAKLQPYDGVRYDVPEWKEVTVHPDHHVQFEQALYSAPATTCPPGTKLEVRGDQKLVKLYRKGELVKVHVRQPRGSRATDPDDYPKEKTAYALRSTDAVVRRATTLGPSVEAFAQKLFEGPLPWAKLRAGQKLISLGERYGGERLDAACQRSLAYDLVDVRRLQRILLQALDHEPPVEEETGTPLGSRFARPGSAFDRHQPAFQETTG